MTGFFFGTNPANNTPITSTASLTGSHPTPRALDDRFSDIINVKDFGATGDGVTDDLQFIQDAVDWTANSARGMIYFPPGIYHVSASINLQWMTNATYPGLPSFVICGCGDASKISGNFADYIFKRAPSVYVLTIGATNHTTTSATASGDTLNFSGGTAANAQTITVGMLITDNTTGGVIPANTLVIAVGATTVQMSNAVTGGGVLMGDVIHFAPTVTSGTLTSSNILTFAGGTPASIAIGQAIVNLTHSTSISSTTVVQAVGATTVTMSQNATGPGVSTSDEIKFTEAYSSDTDMVIRDMTITNSSNNNAGGAVQIVCNVGVLLENLKIGGANGIVLTNGYATNAVQTELFNFTGTVLNCVVRGSGKASVGGTNTGTAISLGQGCLAIGCDINGFQTGIRTAGVDNNIIGGRIEECTTGILTGIDVFGNTAGVGGAGLIIGGMSMEQNDTSIDMTNGVVDCLITSMHISALDGNGVDGIKFPSGTATKVTVMSTEVIGGFSGYAIRTPGTGGASFYRTFIGVYASNTSSGSRVWEMPAAAYVAQFISSNNPDPTYTFANLPSGGLVVRRIGDTYNLSDGKTTNCADGTCTTFGTVVSAGGGALPLQVRWNGTNWTLNGV